MHLVCRLLTICKSVPLAPWALEAAITRQLAPGERVLRWAIVEVREDCWIIDAGIRTVA